MSPTRIVAPIWSAADMSDRPPSQPQTILTVLTQMPAFASKDGPRAAIAILGTLILTRSDFVAAAGQWLLRCWGQSRRAGRKHAASPKARLAMCCRTVASPRAGLGTGAGLSVAADPSDQRPAPSSTSWAA